MALEFACCKGSCGKLFLLCPDPTVQCYAYFAWILRQRKENCYLLQDLTIMGAIGLFLLPDFTRGWWRTFFLQPQGVGQSSLTPFLVSGRGGRHKAIYSVHIRPTISGKDPDLFDAIVLFSLVNWELCNIVKYTGKY